MVEAVLLRNYPTEAKEEEEEEEEEEKEEEVVLGRGCPSDSKDGEFDVVLEQYCLSAKQENIEGFLEQDFP